MSTDQTYYDYLEMGSSQPESTPVLKRKSIWAAMGTALLLAGASVAYTTSTDIRSAWWPRFESASESVTATALEADERLPLWGNKVSIEFPYGLKDGVLTTAVVVVNPALRGNPPPVVQITAPGLQLGQQTFYISPRNPSSFRQRVACRTTTGSSVADNGKIVALPVTIEYPTTTIKTETQVAERELQASASCGGWGDPHLTTFDGVAYDFQPPGVFRYFKIRDFEVQVFQEFCQAGRSAGDVPRSCYRAVAITYADSVLRLYAKDRKLWLAKGSDTLRWFQVYQFRGQHLKRGADAYRIFLSVDQISYIDVFMSVNKGSREVVIDSWLAIEAQLSPVFKDPSIVGLMGNWNGNKGDDSRNATELEAAHGYALTDNLFTCTDCSQWVHKPTMDDELSLTLQAVNANLRQGLTAIDDANVPVEPYTPTWSTRTTSPLLAATDVGEGSDEAPTVGDVTRRALELCDRVISEIATCNKYVPNKSFFIYNVCLEDSALLGDLAVVDNTKLGYLRECRRELEARFIAAAGNATELSALRVDRETLQFGDVLTCPQSCNGHGECLSAGCKCDAGYTGYTCNIEI